MDIDEGFELGSGRCTIKTEHGVDVEGRFDESAFDEGALPETYLELWIDNAEVGEPSFRYFYSHRTDLIEAYRDHTEDDGALDVVQLTETAPGSEWVVVSSGYGGGERAWAKLRETW